MHMIKWNLKKRNAEMQMQKRKSRRVQENNNSKRDMKMCSYDVAHQTKDYLSYHRNNAIICIQIKLSATAMQHDA